MKMSKKVLTRIIKEETAAVLKEVYSTGESLITFTDVEGVEESARKTFEEHFMMAQRVHRASMGKRVGGIYLIDALEMAQSGQAQFVTFCDDEDEDCKLKITQIVINVCRQAFAFWKMLDEALKYDMPQRSSREIDRNAPRQHQVHEEEWAQFRIVMSDLTEAAKTANRNDIRGLQRPAAAALDLINQLWSDIRDKSAEDWEDEAAQASEESSARDETQARFDRERAEEREYKRKISETRRASK